MKTPEWSRKAAKIMQKIEQDRELTWEQANALKRALQKSRGEADLSPAFKKYINAVERDERPEEPAPVSDAVFDETIRKVKKIINQFEPETVYNIEVVAGLRPGPKKPDSDEQKSRGFLARCRKAESDIFETIRTAGVPFAEVLPQLTRTEDALLGYLIFSENI